MKFTIGKKINQIFFVRITLSNTKWTCSDCPLFCSSICSSMFPLCSSLRGTLFFTKNGVITPYIYIYESVFPLFLYCCMLLENFNSHWRFLFIRKFFIAFIFLGEQGEQGEQGVLTPFRGEQKGEQNSSKWNKKGEQGNTLILSRGTDYFVVHDTRRIAF